MFTFLFGYLGQTYDLQLETFDLAGDGVSVGQHPVPEFHNADNSDGCGESDAVQDPVPRRLGEEEPNSAEDCQRRERNGVDVEDHGTDPHLGVELTEPVFAEPAGILDKDAGVRFGELRVSLADGLTETVA